MHNKKYNRIDKKNVAVTETQEVTKNFTVDGITSRKKHLDEQLSLVNEIIKAMKAVGAEFEPEG